MGEMVREEGRKENRYAGGERKKIKKGIREGKKRRRRETVGQQGKTGEKEGRREASGNEGRERERQVGRGRKGTHANSTIYMRQYQGAGRKGTEGKTKISKHGGNGKKKRQRGKNERTEEQRQRTRQKNMTGDTRMWMHDRLMLKIIHFNGS